MTITAAPLSIEHRGSAVSASAWFHTSDPGEFAVDYPDGITGPPTVEAAGTRVWRNGLKHGQYLARANCLQARDPVTFYIEFEMKDVIGTGTTAAGANGYDGIFNGDATYPLTKAPRVYTDTDIEPYQPFTITPNSLGTFTITARRRRAGVPDRATDEEKWEETSETFTITSMPNEAVEYVRLLITASRDGVVDIVSSDPSVVTFPASVSIGPTLQFEVLGTVVGAGISTITTSMEGTTLDTTTVTIEAEPVKVYCGPSQDIRSRLP